MKCQSCGTILDETIVKCPYCGSTNFPGAEKEYMNELHELHQNLEKLEDVPMDYFEDTIKSESSRVGKRIGISLLIAALLALGIFLLFQFNDSQLKKQDAAQTAWERTAFPKMDVWYEEGNYDAVLNYILTDSETQKFSTHNWKHSDFIWAYADYLIITDPENNREKDIMTAMTSLLIMTRLEDMRKEDSVMVKAYQKEAEQILNERYHMSIDQLKKLYDEEVKK